MDSPEFATLISLQQRSLYGYIYSLTSDVNITWDVLQETNLVLWKKKNEFQSGSNFEAWAFTVARFQCMAYFRDKKRDPHQLLTPELLETFGNEPEQEFQKSQSQMKALRHCHSLLKEKSKRLIKLYYYDGLNLKQISNELNMSPNALKQALFRIRKKLRDCIEQQSFET